jgi:hypothetical protein
MSLERPLHRQYGYRVVKNGNDCFTDCRHCDEHKICYFWMLVRHGERKTHNIFVKGGSSPAYLCGRKCAKGYALPQFAVMRLQGKI